METTEWEKYGTGNYEKCANCMVHCGYEPTAVNETVKHPLKAFMVWRRGIETEAPMVPEISLKDQRPAEFVFEKIVSTAMKSEPEAKKGKAKSSRAA